MNVNTNMNPKLVAEYAKKEADCALLIEAKSRMTPEQWRRSKAMAHTLVVLSEIVPHIDTISSFMSTMEGYGRRLVKRDLEPNDPALEAAGITHEQYRKLVLATSMSVGDIVELCFDILTDAGCPESLIAEGRNSIYTSGMVEFDRKHRQKVEESGFND